MTRAPVRRWLSRLTGWLRQRPFVAGYLAATWIASVAIAVPAAGHESPLYFSVPDLTGDPLRALGSLATAPWLQVGKVQIVYVTVLMLVFGGMVERQEGTLRTATLFFATTAFGAVIAGTLLTVAHPAVVQNASLEFSWERAWGGGSAGCFGLMGALAARSRHPERMLLLFMAWEALVWTVDLRSYTSAFHLAALFAGFGITGLLPARPVRRGVWEPSPNG